MPIIFWISIPFLTKYKTEGGTYIAVYLVVKYFPISMSQIGFDLALSDRDAFIIKFQIRGGVSKVR